MQPQRLGRNNVSGDWLVDVVELTRFVITVDAYAVHVAKCADVGLGSRDAERPNVSTGAFGPGGFGTVDAGSGSESAWGGPAR